MDCENVREEFVERLTGPIDPERSKAIDEHLAGCEACRAETDRLRELWGELGALRVPAASAAAGRVGRLIDARAGTARSIGSKSAATRRVAIAALGLAASLFVGVLVGQRFRGDQPVVAAAAPSERYVLLLHGPARTTPATPAEATADSVAEQAIVAEYRAWAVGLRESGKLVLAEKLADSPLAMLTPAGEMKMPSNSPDELGGFFLIQADSAEAFRIARACPHLKHGGTVQVRRIQPT